VSLRVTTGKAWTAFRYGGEDAARDAQPDLAATPPLAGESNSAITALFNAPTPTDFAVGALRGVGAKPAC